MSMTIKAPTEQINAWLKSIEQDISKAIRPAAQAGAQVLYEEVKGNVAKIKQKTGNLANSIYQAFSAQNSSEEIATYHISWNLGWQKGSQSKTSAAPHGHLIEYGHWQRYVAFLGKDGEWHTAIRPEMRGKPKPKRRASQTEKDAYYVLLPTPVWIGPQPFLRPAAAKFPQALDACEKRLLQELSGDS